MFRGAVVVALLLIMMGCATKRPVRYPVVTAKHITQIDFGQDCVPEKDGVHVMCDHVRVTTDGTVEYRDKKGGEMRKR